jgi:hypothetical protein
MNDILDKLIGFGLVLTAAITLWAVTTPNHLYVG